MATAVALAAWVAAARWLAPAAIRWIHDGGGPAVLGRLMGGRGNVPLADYLRAWDHLAPRVTFVATTLALVAWFAVPAFLAVRRWRREALEPADLPPAVPLGFRTALMTSAWGGLVLGLGEAYYLAWKTLILHEVVPDFSYASIDSVWMAPLMDVLLLVALGAAAWGLARLLRRPLTLRWLVGLLAFLTLATLILITGRLARWAAPLLALGLAVRLAPVAARHQDRFFGLVRRAVPRLAALVVAVGLLLILVPRTLERLALERLPGAAPGAPNVLVIVVDTERAANLSLYGYHRATTPNLIRLAGEGVVFDRAIAAAPWTLPSHASMFTSRYPNELSTSFTTPLDDTYPTLAEVMRDRGYLTGGFVGNIFFCSPLFGLNRGFTHYEAQPVSLEMTLESAWLPRTAYQLLHPGVEDFVGVHKDAARVTHDFLAWESRTGDRPFFAFLNYFDAHGPYRSPPAYRSRFVSDPAVPLVFHGKLASRYTPAQIARLEDAYDGAIAYVDREIGALIDSLRQRDVLRRTLVIITADHGEEFGEHGFIGHTYGIHRPLLRVPLLVLDPSLPGGERVATPVSMASLAATVMDVAGVDGHPFRGRSWLRLLAPPPSDAPPADAPVFSQYGGRASVIAGRWQLVEDGGEHLFDVQADPAEHDDLIAAIDTAVVETLRHDLAAFESSERADFARESWAGRQTRGGGW